MRIAIILFVLALPFVELALLIKVGQLIGFWWTMLIILGTAVGGGLIVHEQGFSTLRRAQAAVSEGRLPVEPVIDGVFLMFAGGLLVAPGLITDTLGALLLIPPLRRWIARWLFHQLLHNAEVHVRTSTYDGRGPDGGDPRHARRPDGRRGEGDGGGIVIDGEWERVDDPKPGSRKPGPGGKQNRLR
ncbi:MAG: FxsA family protein [Hyphomicrobiaceae bacterium]